jgi:thiamine pyridinylase
MWGLPSACRRNILFPVALSVPLVCVTGLQRARLARAESPPRHLRVVLYPYVPDYPGLVQEVTRRFAATPEGQGVILDLPDLTNGYYDSTSELYVGKAVADVYELDSVLLDDFHPHKIRALPDALTPKPDEFLPVAQKRAFLNATAYGYPHWVCANFLFYRKGDTAVASARTLPELESALNSPTQAPQPLLADFKGKSTLGEFYLMSLFDRYQLWPTIQNHLSPMEADQVNDVVRLAALCRQGYCHSGDRHNAVGSYGREFARGHGRTLIGYSEILYDVADESRRCGKDEQCLSPGDLDVGLVPMDDRGVTPMVWVDSYTLSTSCTGQCEQDAINFIRFVDSEDTQRHLLTGSPARYLLPARASLYSDPDTVRAAPLYPKLRGLVENGDSPTKSGLNDTLLSDGSTIDGILPQPSGS